MDENSNDKAFGSMVLGLLGLAVVCATLVALTWIVFG